ncbi:unnamed protein product, partial [Brassica rapa subsp. trilocularis]
IQTCCSYIRLENNKLHEWVPAGAIHHVEIHDNQQISDEDDRNLKYVGSNALMAWEKVRAGLKTLLLVYPSKVCNRRVNEGINYYGHASAVASLCSHASALVSNTKYACEMKPRGLSFPFSNSSPYQET